MRRSQPHGVQTCRHYRPRGAILGCDYCETVAKIGSKVPGNWTLGGRVAGWAHGGLYSDRGSFAEYLKTPADLAWKPLSCVSDEEAATFGVSAVTAMLVLNVRLGVPWVDEDPIKGQSNTQVVFIYYRTTAAGLYAIQLTKLAGWKVVTTAYPRSHDLVKQYGADDVFDSRSPSAIKRHYANLSRH